MLLLKLLLRKKINTLKTITIACLISNQLELFIFHLKLLKNQFHFNIQKETCL